MKISRSLFSLVLVAVAALMAALAFVGHPLVPPEALAGVGFVPLVNGVTTLDDILDLTRKQGDAMQPFFKKVDALEAGLLDLQKKSGRAAISGLSGTGGLPESSPVEKWYDAKTRTPVPVLEHKQSLARLGGNAEPPSSIGRVLRGLVLGGRADDAKQLEDERKSLGISSDPAGGYTVSGALSGEWIDSLRASMVLSRAGARTVPMPANALTLARVVADPAVVWHGENAPLSGSEPTFGAVTLNAKTVVCLVKMSLELSQDSANIEQILESVITAAMAQEIDKAGLAGTSSGAGAAPGAGTGIVELVGRNTVTGIGAPTSWDFLVDGMYELMVDNVPETDIGAMIAHPALWKKMTKLKTGIASDNTPLPVPSAVQGTPKLWSTAAPLSGGTTATGVIANWRDLLFGVRQDITVRVLQEAFLGSNLQVAVLAYARVDFAATRAQSFCTLEGITVA